MDNPRSPVHPGCLSHINPTGTPAPRTGHRAGTPSCRTERPATRRPPRRGCLPPLGRKSEADLAPAPAVAVHQGLDKTQRRRLVGERELPAAALEPTPAGLDVP